MIFSVTTMCTTDGAASMYTLANASLRASASLPPPSGGETVGVATGVVFGLIGAVAAFLGLVGGCAVAVAIAAGACLGRTARN